MGAWAVLAFDNDNALDWVWSLEEAEDTSVLSETLEAVASADELDEDCEEALAAAEVVAALGGHPLAKLPEEVTAFVQAQGKQKPSAELVRLATTAVQRIAEASELKASWDESEHAKEWQQAMKDLLRRLGA